jgi:hypothetical protein
MIELHVVRLTAGKFQEVRYAIFEEGGLSKPIALLTEYEFKRFLDRCSEAVPKSIGKKK